MALMCPRKTSFLPPLILYTIPLPRTLLPSPIFFPLLKPSKDHCCHHIGNFLVLCSRPICSYVEILSLLFVRVKTSFYAHEGFTVPVVCIIALLGPGAGDGGGFAQSCSVCISELRKKVLFLVLFVVSVTWQLLEIRAQLAGQKEGQ